MEFRSIGVIVGAQNSSAGSLAESHYSAKALFLLRMGLKSCGASIRANTRNAKSDADIAVKDEMYAQEPDH